MDSVLTKIAGKKGLKLNLGSSSRPIEGFLNVDILPLPGVDIVCDLEQPLPFEDNSVTQICGNHIVEHMKNLVPLMKELYRICEDGATLQFRIPYYTSESAFKDPTHVRFIGEKTFSYFSRKAQKYENLPDYDLHVDFDIERFQYMYYKRWFALPILRTFLKRYCWNIVKTMTVSLRVIKPPRA